MKELELGDRLAAEALERAKRQSLVFDIPALCAEIERRGRALLVALSAHRDICEPHKQGQCILEATVAAILAGEEKR